MTSVPFVYLKCNFSYSKFTLKKTHKECTFYILETFVLPIYRLPSSESVLSIYSAEKREIEYCEQYTSLDWVWSWKRHCPYYRELSVSQRTEKREI